MKVLLHRLVAAGVLLVGQAAFAQEKLPQLARNR